MNLAITATLATTVLVVASTAAAGDSVLVSSAMAPSRLSLDQRAVNACFNAFVAQLLPGNSAGVRTVTDAGSPTIFTSIQGSLLAPYEVMAVEMSAAKAQSGDLLAKSTCRVNRDAKVLQLETHVTNTENLAGLTLKEVRLAMARY